MMLGYAKLNHREACQDDNLGRSCGRYGLPPRDGARHIGSRDVFSIDSGRVVVYRRRAVLGD
jgi:hypothetical protein